MTRVHFFVTFHSELSGTSQREKQKTTETGIAVFIIINPTVLPQLYAHFITLFQWENNTIENHWKSLKLFISIGLRLQKKHRALDLIILMETDCHFVKRVSMSIKSEEIDSFHWCCESTCKAHTHMKSETVKKCF